MVIETCPKCGSVLMNTVIYTDGWHWEGKPESIEYRPFGGNGLEGLYDKDV